MNAVNIFFFEVAASVAISTFILIRLQHLLPRLQRHHCAKMHNEVDSLHRLAHRSHVGQIREDHFLQRVLAVHVSTVGKPDGQRHPAQSAPQLACKAS